MGRERRPAPVVAVGDGRPGAGPEEPELRRRCESDGPLGTHGLEGRRARGSRSDWLAQPGLALLDVKVKPMQLVTPPSPFVSPEAVVGMAVYSAKALLHGKGGDVWEMMVENIP